MKRHLLFIQALLGGGLIIYGIVSSISNPIYLIFVLLGLFPFANSTLDLF